MTNVHLVAIEVIETLEYQVAVVGCCSGDTLLTAHLLIGGLVVPSLASPVCMSNKLGQDTKYTKLLCNASIDRNSSEKGYSW